MGARVGECLREFRCKRSQSRFVYRYPSQSKKLFADVLVNAVVDRLDGFGFHAFRVNIVSGDHEMIVVV